MKSPSHLLSTKVRIDPEPCFTSKTTLFAHKSAKRLFHNFALEVGMDGRFAAPVDFCHKNLSAQQKLWSLFTPLDLPATSSLEIGANLYPAMHKNNKKINPTPRKRTQGN